MSDNDLIDSTDTLVEEVHETPAATPNFRTELAAQLAELVPEAIADGKVDVEKLKELLNDDVADSSERFGLFWPGKKRALRAAQEPTTATLKPDFENSKDWDTTQNVFIEGDNLEVLKILQKHYHAKIKLIYIDPPYNTGKDFVYPDNYKEGLDTYLEWTRQVNEEGKKVTTNPETEGRYHSNWLNMMYPRLKLARNLLSADGVVLISIGEEEVANLRLICDQVFGEQNFVSKIVWHNNTKGRQMDAHIKGTYESILVYARNINSLAINGVRESVNTSGMELDEISPYTKGYPLHNGTADFHINNRPNLAYSIYYDPATSDAKCIDEKAGTFGALEIGEISSEGRRLLASGYRRVIPKFNSVYGNQRVWRWGQEKFVRDYRTELIFIEEDGGPYFYQKKRFLDGIHETKPKNYIALDSGNAKKELMSLFGANVFDNPKPTSLLIQLLRLGIGKSEIVLDFFAGSGSTAHAVMALNAEDQGSRKFICIQLPEPTPDDSVASKAGFTSIPDVARKRLELAGNQIKAKATAQEVDTGFRSYKLSDTNFAKWQLSSDVAEDALQQHLLSLRDSATDDASADELLTEILIKQGYSLTEAVAPAEIGGLDVRLVGDRDGDIAMLAYLNQRVKPTLEQLRALVGESPTRIIVLEDAFQGDDELKTNLAQLCKSKSIEFWTA